MEMNCAELAAVDGVACDLLHANGRLVVAPHALTLEGLRNVSADLRHGESLAVFLERHVPGIASGAWTVSIGGATVPKAMWARTFPKHGQLIACRALVARQAVQLVAMAALAYFSMGMATGIYGAMGGTFVSAAAGTYIGAIQVGVLMAGSMLINKVLGPKVPKMGEAAAARQVHSLSSQSNRDRKYEPLPTLWGEMRITPDLAGKPYGWFDGENQYLSTVLLGGINVQSAADLSVGDTPLSSFEEVSVFYNGFSGMASEDIPLYGNVDAIAGADLENDGAWVMRTSSTGTMALQVDIEGQLYDIDNKGNTLVNSVPLFIETRPVGAVAWQAVHSVTLTNATMDVLRRTYTVPVASGQHEVRVRLGKPTYDEGSGKDACKFVWTALKSIQPDTADYSGLGRIGIKIKATGQLSGSLDTLRATYRARPLPVWNGTEWITATTREQGLSNPGAILLQTLRGVYALDRNGVRQLQFGFGMSDDQIDIEGLKAFMLHCAARGYTYDRWVTSSMSLGQFCEEVALAGMGEFSWTDGSRPTAVFVSSGQPLSGVVNMANMLKGSFSVAYNLANAADGIEYQYLDRDRNWETQTLRVAAPGVTTMLNPAQLTGEGVTTEAHAAVLARYHLAQSLYQYKTVDFGADIEHLAYRRLSVLSISHDLTQWGFGGRVMAAGTNATGKVELQLDEPVPALAQGYVGLRVPGARDYRVFRVEPFEESLAASDVITLVEPWPENLDFPGEDLDNPAHDTLWCYDFKATPGYRVRVVGMQPEADLKGAQVTCVPEGPEFWDYVLNGIYTPAPNQSSLPQLGRPKVSNLRITEKVNVQGDTEWYSLGLVWDVEGDYDHAQVWAGRDGSELRLVDGNAVGSRSEFRIDGAGEWLIEVRPFNASGLVGQSATVLYITSMTQLPPRNVDDFVVQSVAGGLRRFAWQYSGDRPPAFAGVQIRYLPGDVVLSVADWDSMQPLGEADDIYSAQFETTRPQAGLWTFGCRAIDTAGQLANGVVRFVASLGDSFEQVQQPDSTPPPAVTGLAAVPMLAGVQVNWDVATYTAGHGHARTVIYAAQGADATFAQAQQVAEGYGGPVSFGSEPATTWTIWAKHQSVDGVLSDDAGQAVVVTTGEDVEKLLDVLQGQITESQLYQDLADEIELISGTADGSVNARLLTEAQERARAVALEAQARAQDVAQIAANLRAASDALQGNIDAVNAQVADIIGASDYSSDKAYDAGQLVKSQGKLYLSKVAVPANNPPPAAAYWDLVGDYDSIGEAVAAHAAQLTDHSTRIGQTEQGLTAEASARNVLATQLRGSYTGTDVAQVSAGLVWSERQSRVAGDSANASLIQGVRSDLTSTQGTVAGQGTAISGLQSGVTSINGTLTSQASSITQLQASVASASEGLKAMNSLGAEAEWMIVGSSAGAVTTNAVEGATAGAVLTVGGNTGGNDMHWLRHSASMPFDETRLYKITARFRRTAGNGGIYFGIAALNASKSRYVNSLNVESSGIGSAHYAVINAMPALNVWQTVEGYYRGRSAGAVTGSGTLAAPWAFANKVAHLSLLFLGNYNGASGSCELDFITFEDVTESAKAAADVVSEAVTRAAEDGALASRATALEARMPAGAGQLATAAALSSLSSEVSQQAGTIASQGSSITSVKASLADNSSNKLANTLFLPDGKQPVTDTAGAISVFTRSQLPVDVLDGCPGSSCVALTLTAGTTTVLRFPFLDSVHPTSASRARGWVPSRATVDVGCWVFVPAAVVSGARLACWYYKADGVTLVSSAVIFGTSYNKSISGWQYLSGRAIIPADAACLTFAVQALSGVVGDVVYAAEPYVSVQSPMSARLDATADALSSLQSTVTSQGNSLTSQGASIISLSNSISGLQGAADNLLKASNVEQVRAASAYQIGNAYATTETLAVGETYTLVACLSHAPASGDATSSVGAWVNGSQTIAANMVRNGSMVVATATFVRVAAGAGTNIAFYYYPSSVKTGTATVHWACLYKGKVVPPLVWQPSVAELEASVAANSSATSALTTRVTSAEGQLTAQTTQLSQIQASVAGNTSAIQQNASAQADVNGYVAAQYSMKVQVASNGKTAVGGMAVQGTSTGTAGPTIDFGIMANTFWVGAPAGSGLTSANLFVVRTAATTINGQPVPAGVYFGDAFIGNGTITSAKIGKLQVDDGHMVSLSVAKLLAGSLAVGQYIQSTSYVAGSAGWRINANGTAEFSGVVVRGTIYATAGQIGTFSINANGLNSGGYTAYSWPTGSATGVHISHQGILIGNPSAGRYLQITETGNIYTPKLTIENGNAYFSGWLSAATGTFSGSLTAQAVNAVNTINIAGNAVTVPSAHSAAGYGASVAISLDVAAPVLVIATFFGQQISWFTPVVRRNGVEIFRGNGFSSGGVNPTVPITITGVDYPGAGVHTYTVANVGDGSSSSTTISVIGVKR